MSHDVAIRVCLCNVHVFLPGCRLQGVAVGLHERRRALSSLQPLLDSLLAALENELEGVFGCPICKEDVPVQNVLCISCCGHRLCRCVVVGAQAV